MYGQVHYFFNKIVHMYQENLNLLKIGQHL
jgi:hypothetical protein